MGFRKVGSWLSIEGDPRCELVDCVAATNVLYAFVLDGEVVYLGKTLQSLKRRMYGYCRPGPTQSTNIECNRLIQEALGAAQALDVYVLPDNGLLYYGGFHVNLAAGLEDGMVRELKPRWNRRGI